jgi:CDP-diacylglycerol--glycerol-3-phosphate 3-phosphatidyltransferase
MIDGRRGRAGVKQAAGSATVPPAVEAGSPSQKTSEQPERAHLGVRFGGVLARHGVTPNQVTVAGLFLAAATGVVIGLGQLYIGVVLLTVGGLMDTLDGLVAKAAGSSSRRGAFFDSVSDRVADGLMFGGLAWYLAAGRTPEYALLPLAILAVGNIISYERAKAESFGWTGKGGLMERAERLILLGAALAFHVVLIPLLVVLLALCVFTAIQRFAKIWAQATAELTGEPVVARRTPAGIASWRPARVESRWAEWRLARAEGKSLAPLSRTGRSRRREVALSTRLRAVLASERAGVSARAPHAERQSARLIRRRREGAASALHRRLGNGR